MNKTKIYVVCDNSMGSIDSHYSRQLLSKGRILSEQMGGEVAAICINEYDEQAFSNLLEYGANKIIYTDGIEQLSRSYADAIEKIADQEKPNLIMFQADLFSKELASILSTRLEAGLTADCVDVLVDEHGDFIFERAALSDSILAQIKAVNCQTAMCTVKKDVFIEERRSHIFNRNTDIRRYDMAGSMPVRNSRIELLQRSELLSTQDIDLSRIKMMVGIGRGVGNKGIIENIYNFADKYGAAVVGTRGAVEDGMISATRQVGQSGISISPDIYISLGISGASQHMVGLRNAKTIIAVNHDSNAAIFKYANYSIVADVEEVLGGLVHI